LIDSFPFSFQVCDASLQRLQVRPIHFNERLVAHLPMTGNDANWPKGLDLVDRVNPRLNARIIIEGQEAAIHQNISGKENPIAFDENECVAVGVRAAVPQQSDANASQIKNLFGIKEFIGWPELCVLHQLCIRRRSRGEVRLHAKFFDVSLLWAGTNDLR
jgi:hypothetical protein